MRDDPRGLYAILEAHRVNSTARRSGKHAVPAKPTPVPLRVKSVTPTSDYLLVTFVVWEYAPDGSYTGQQGMTLQMKVLLNHLPAIWRKMNPMDLSFEPKTQPHLFKALRKALKRHWPKGGKLALTV